MPKKKDPIFAQITREVMEDLNSGLISPGEKLPSEEKLAEKKGISRLTARRAYVNLCNMGYAEAIRGSGTYIKGNITLPLPDISAPGFKKRISVFFPEPLELFFDILKPLETGCSKTGYSMKTDFALSPEKCFDIAKKITGSNPNGIIFSPFRNFPEARAAYRIIANSNIPCISIGFPPGELSCDHVRVYDKPGIFEAVKRYSEKGHKSILGLFDSASDSFAYIERVAAYRDSTEEFFPENSFLITDLSESDSVKRMLDTIRSNKITCIICDNEALLTHLYYSLREAGIFPPSDIEITCFKGTEFFRSLGFPFSVIEADTAALGKEAFSMIKDMIRSGGENKLHSTGILIDSFFSEYNPS